MSGGKEQVSLHLTINRVSMKEKLTAPALLFVGFADSTPFSVATIPPNSTSVEINSSVMLYDSCNPGVTTTSHLVEFSLRQHLPLSKKTFDIGPEVQEVYRTGKEIEVIEFIRLEKESGKINATVSFRASISLKRKANAQTRSQGERQQSQPQSRLQTQAQLESQPQGQQESRLSHRKQSRLDLQPSVPIEYVESLNEKVSFMLQKKNRVAAPNERLFKDPKQFAVAEQSQDKADSKSMYKPAPLTPKVSTRLFQEKPAVNETQQPQGPRLKKKKQPQGLGMSLPQKSVSSTKSIEEPTQGKSIDEVVPTQAVTPTASVAEAKQSPPLVEAVGDEPTESKKPGKEFSFINSSSSSSSIKLDIKDEGTKEKDEDSIDLELSDSFITTEEKPKMITKNAEDETLENTAKNTKGASQTDKNMTPVAEENKHDSEEAQGIISSESSEFF